MGNKGKIGGFGGGMNIGNIMKQAQKLQEDMLAAQQKLSEKTVEASAGGGMVTVVMTCDKRIKEINIAPEVVDPEDITTLQDLIIASISEAYKKADEEFNSEMAKYSGGTGGFPGLF